MKKTQLTETMMEAIFKYDKFIDELYAMDDNDNTHATELNTFKAIIGMVYNMAKEQRLSEIDRVLIKSFEGDYLYQFNRDGS